MSKTMCEMNKKDREEKQADPKYKCKRCEALAHKEKHLCKPKKIKDELE